MLNVYCIGCNNTEFKHVQDVFNLYKHPNRMDKMFETVIGFQVTEDTHLCDECAVKLRGAYNFKTQCLAVLKLYDLESIPPSLSENQPHTVFMPSKKSITINPHASEVIKLEELDPNIIFEDEMLSENEEEIDPYQTEETESIYVAQHPDSPSVSEKDVSVMSVEELEETERNTEAAEYLDTTELPEDSSDHIEPDDVQKRYRIVNRTPDLQETYKLVNQQKKEGKQRRSFTTSVKLQLVEYAEKHGNYQTGRDFNLSEASVRGWRKQKDLLLSADKGTRRAFRKGAPHWPQLEVKLRCWIKQNINLSDDEIKSKALKIAKESGILNFVCSRRWFEAFKTRSRLNECIAEESTQNEMVEIDEIPADEVQEAKESITRSLKRTRNWQRRNDDHFEDNLVSLN